MRPRLAPPGLLLLACLAVAAGPRSAAVPAVPPSAAVAVPAAATGAAAGYDVLDYSADLEVRPAEMTVAGEVAIRLAAVAEPLSEVELDAEDLAIQGVWSGDRPLVHREAGGKLHIQLLVPLRRADTATLRVRYSAGPSRGIRLTAGQVYTVFHTRQWLVAKDEPGDKATLTLRLTLPAGLEAAASGRLVAREVLPDGRTRSTWREDRPTSTFLFGFAAARFHEAAAREGSVELRFLSSGLTAEQMATIFAGTAEMLRFFTRRAGLAYPGERYSQVLLPDAPAQEMDRLSLMSESYGRSVLEDPREDYLVAHELAHQWWGNLVTCADWSDFWLNEGLATYMAAAYKEQHWGLEEYRREMLIARLRYERALAERPARPLVWTGWSKAEEMSGAITYSKGALVLHLLRHELGDHDFWEGLHLYTTRAAAAGGLARTRDLERAMAAASGKDLAWFFDQWAYGTEPALAGLHRYEPGAVVVEVEQRGAVTPWKIGLTIAVETATERVSRRVVLARAKETWRLPVSGPPLSVRLDDGGYLPRSIDHERPPEMLRYQAVHEPDPAGRADALLAFSRSCDGASLAARCAALPALLRDRTAEDPARIVRQLAERALERLTGKASR